LSEAEATSVTWRKTSACMPSECVEVSNLNGRVLVRDSVDRSGPQLSFEVDQWNSFLQLLADDKSKFIAPQQRLQEAADAAPRINKGHSGLPQDESLATRSRAAA
jgi:hypothetical protein